MCLIPGGSIQGVSVQYQMDTCLFQESSIRLTRPINSILRAEIGLNNVFFLQNLNVFKGWRCTFSYCTCLFLKLFLRYYYFVYLVLIFFPQYNSYRASDHSRPTCEHHGRQGYYLHVYKEDQAYFSIYMHSY